MTDSKPELCPEESMESSFLEGDNTAVPTEVPPTVQGNDSTENSTIPANAGMGEAAPSTQVNEGGIGDISAWHSNKRIGGLWSISQNRNAYVNIKGVGWKKLINTSDSAIVALTMLASHALEKDASVNCLEENDGMIHSMYVW